MPCGRWTAANESGAARLLDLSRDPLAGRSTLFMPGPYHLGASGRAVHHDNDPRDASALVAVVPCIHTAHLLKAAPDLYAVAAVLAREKGNDTLTQAARVACARALGLLS